MFASKTGTSPDQRNVANRGLKLACREAGLEGVSFHVLRHTFASAGVLTSSDLAGRLQARDDRLEVRRLVACERERLDEFAVGELSVAKPAGPRPVDLALYELTKDIRDRAVSCDKAELPPRLVINLDARHPVAYGRRPVAVLGRGFAIGFASPRSDSLAYTA